MNRLLQQLLARGYWEQAGGEGQGGEGGAGTGEGEGQGGQGEGGTGEGQGQGQGGAGEGQGEGEGEGQGQVTTSASWRDEITDGNLKKFSEQFNTPQDALKTAFEFRQKLSNVIPKIGKNATDEEKAAYRKALGVPDSAEGYSYQMPDTSDWPETVNVDELQPIIGDMKTMLHETGSTPEQAKSIIDYTLNRIVEGHKADSAQFEENIAKADTALKNEWGDEFEKNNNYAQRGFKQFANEEFTSALTNATYEGVELVNHPAFIKVFSDIGRKMGEGGLQTIMTQADQESFEAEQERLTEEAQAALNAGNNAKANRLFDERARKSKQYYGDS